MPPSLRPFLARAPSPRLALLAVASLCLALSALFGCSDRGSSPVEAHTEALFGDPVVWAQRQKFGLADATPTARFGERLSQSGDTLIVGAPSDNQVATAAGAAFVYVRGTDGWTLQQKLIVPGGAASDAFGASVAISGDVAVVGAWGVDGAAVDTGAAYVFTRTGTTWTQSAKLVASDPEELDHFGVSVVLSGANLAVAAPSKTSGTQYSVGAVYTFNGAGSDWKFQSKLMPTTTANDNTGTGLAVSGTALAIGTDRARGFAVAYYTLRNGPSTAGAASVTSTNTAFAHFGSRLALSRAYTAVGSYADDVGPATSAGSVTVITNAAHDTQWTIRASDPAANDQFGSAVALTDTGSLVVGSPRDDDKGNDSGSVYVFDLVDGSWVEKQKITAQDGAAGDRFGAAIATAGSLLLVSAPGAGAGAGALYSFAGVWVNGSVCASGDECASGACVENVCCDPTCSGTCRSCLAAYTGKPNGTCASSLATLDPDQECAETASGSCGTTGLCDGAGACATHAAGTACASSACVSPTVAPVTTACDGKGTCAATSTLTCSVGFQCAAGTCRTTCQSDSDCDIAQGFVCSASQVCKLPNTAACTSGELCESGTCQNAICCTPRSNGLCDKPLGAACQLHRECAVGNCENGVCTEPMGTGGASGSAGSSSGAAGSSASAGSSGAAGSAGAAGSSGAMATGGTGGASAGIGGSAGRPEAGSGAAAAAANAPNSGIGLQCETHADCPSALGCDPTSNTCQDRVVTACGCRVAGQPAQPRTWAWLLAGVAFAAARRRRARARQSECGALAG